MQAYNRISLLTLKVASIIIAVLVIQGQFFPIYGSFELSLSSFVSSFLVSLVPCLMAYYFMTKFGQDLERWVSETSELISAWVDKASQQDLKVAVVILAGLTLFLELVLIRWQSGLFPIFLLYKNFTLLACFCGIGIGYAMSNKGPSLLFASLPLLAFTLVMMVLLRYGPDRALLDLLHVPTHSAMRPGAMTYYEKSLFGHVMYYLPSLIFLSIAFLLNVLVLLPVAQFCGLTMEKIYKPLESYGYNLLGSIGGVITLFIISWFWGGPVIWFGLSVFMLLYYLVVCSCARTPALIFATISMMVVAWPVDQMTQYIYSPYQLIQKTSSKRGTTSFVASGYYHQNVTNYAVNNTNRIKQKYNYGLWELAYHHSPTIKRALIVGSGVGNDPASALRGGAEKIDAVEIDPAIIDIGKSDHPERPYHDKRVNIIIDDGRGFLRKTDHRYDVITYGMQDTTMLLSQGANVRLDTFVFTQEGLGDAFKILNSGGLLNVLLMIKDDTLVGHKVYEMLSKLPGAGDPKVVKIDGPFPNLSWISFIVKKDAELELSTSYLAEHVLIDVTHVFKDFMRDQSEKLDLPSDDWPFFLMEKKSYPLYYMVSLSLILILSFIIVRQFLPGQKLKITMLPFFFLGAGFMLVETKAITELALVFGNTWQLIAITIASILLMAFIANLFVSKYSGRLVIPAFICLLLTVFLGYLVVVNGLISSSDFVAKILFLILLTSPMFFSGIIFSSLLKSAEDVTGALAYNIIGAMLGGLLEYNALKYGFSSLYCVAIAAYGLAWLTSVYPCLIKTRQ